MCVRRAWKSLGICETCVKPRSGAGTEHEIRSDEFVPCSQGLARLDDQVTILRSFLAQLETSRDPKVEGEEGMALLDSSNLLHSKVQRKFTQLEEGANMLASQVQAFSLQLSSHVERVVGSAKLAVEERNLAESFTTVSKQLAEAEVEVWKGWQVIQECQELLSRGIWKGKHALDQPDDAESRGERSGKENQHNVNGVVPLQIKETAPKCEDSPLSSKTQAHNLDITIQSIKPVKVKRLTKSRVASEDSISQLNCTMGPPLDCSTPITWSRDFPQGSLPPSGKVSHISATTSHSPPILDHCQNSAPVSLPVSVSNHPSALLSFQGGAPSSASARFKALPESSTSSAAEKRLQDVLSQRRRVTEKLQEGFGVWGRPLNPNAEYSENRVYFEGGDPQAFWLCIETEAKRRMQEEIQTMVEESSTVEIQSLGVGSLMLARYSDGQVYRARIVKVLDNTVTVRYIDYGNLEEGLPPSSLYDWQPALEVISAQAMLCCFSLPGGAEFEGVLDDPDMCAFRDVMTQDFLRVVVKRRLQESNHLMLKGSDIDAPELEVSLFSKSGTDVIVKLSRHKLLRKYFQRLTDQKSKQQHIDQRPLLKPPPPLHLTGEEGRPRVEQEGPTSPLPPSIVSRAVDNVIWWFEHKFTDEATSE